MTKNNVKKIIVIDDEVVIALRLQERLTVMGYDVIAISHSGEEGLKKVRSLRPDLILMDIKLPGEMDGITVAEIVKAELDIPIVFLTAFSKDQTIDRAKRAEPYGYIVKPVQDREIKAAIEVALYKKDMERRLRESEERYALAIKGGKVGIWDWNLKTNKIYIAPVLKTILGYKDHEIPNQIEHWANLVHPDDRSKVMKEAQACIDGSIKEYQLKHRMLQKDGSIRWFLASGKVERDANGKAVRFIGTDTDITELKNAEEALQKAHHELERRVQERTKELELKTKNLEEINTAMKVLLKKREEDKLETEENVLTNVKEIILPYLDKIQATKLDNQQKAFLNIIESNMNEIISPFNRKLSLKYLKLTPTEIKIANMVKHGVTSKEIAKILNISSRTVDAHRKNIRTKIGLKKKRANLRSHLLAMH